MFTFRHLPETGGRTPSRPGRHFRFEEAGPLEARRSPSIVAITGAGGLSESSKPAGGFREITVSGMIVANGPIAPTANALLFDEADPDAPGGLAAALLGLGGGRYSFDFPLDLSAKGADGHAGHDYGVAITAADPVRAASTSATFAIGPAETAHAPARPGHPRRSGHPDRA